MDWYPLRLSCPARPLVFGGRAIARTLGKAGLPDWAVGETWEVSDVDGRAAEVLSGPLAGTPLRQLVARWPEELVGDGWSGDRFPLLTKFIDAAGPLPVHVHADDAAARRLEGEPNGKTEAWHVLHAAPGATALCGVRPGVDREALHRALLDQDFDRALRRVPVRPGETFYVPGGTVHSFGPATLVYEIEQTSDVQQHAMRWAMEDGSTLPDEQWRANVEALLDQVRYDARPDPVPGLDIPVDDGVRRIVLCAGPHFALERWRVGGTAPMRHSFRTAQVLSNLGGPVVVRSGSAAEPLGPAQTLLLPAALGAVEIDGPADVLLGHLPDLRRDVLAPLLAAGHGPRAIAALGEGLADAGI
ncbi:type I phosphomannose isomerase catalytic subunit [Saccharopolyspora sp. CA-218241]|uniref:type I phosphomannose isomerase catalytic subunit n=1 Tax=Saccharopolyspora sp. CA-218241 TaxID=3240027 RepID=UPI003D99F06C